MTSRRRLRYPTHLAPCRVVMLMLWAGLMWGIRPQAASGQETFELQGGQWQKAKSYPSDSPRGRLQAIRKLIAEGHGKQAEMRATHWLKSHRSNTPLRPEAYLLRGDAKVLQNRFYRALFDYESLVRAYPASTQYQTALRREYKIAQMFAGGLNRRFLGFRLLPAVGEGEELFIRIQERAPGSKLGEKASLALADHYFESQKMELAAQAYDLFLQNYPRSDHREWAMLRLIQASLARYKGPEYDPTGLIDATQRLKMYRKAYPAAADRMGADALLVRIDESLALKDLVTAKYYERRGEDLSAAYIYQRLERRYPQTAAARTASNRLAKLPVNVGPNIWPASRTMGVTDLPPAKTTESQGAAKPSGESEPSNTPAASPGLAPPSPATPPLPPGRAGGVNPGGTGGGALGGGVGGSQERP